MANSTLLAKAGISRFSKSRAKDLWKPALFEKPLVSVSYNDGVDFSFN